MVVKEPVDFSSQPSALFLLFLFFFPGRFLPAPFLVCRRDDVISCCVAILFKSPALVQSFDTIPSLFLPPITLTPGSDGYNLSQINNDQVGTAICQRCLRRPSHQRIYCRSYSLSLHISRLPLSFSLSLFSLSFSKSLFSSPDCFRF